MTATAGATARRALLRSVRDASARAVDAVGHLGQLPRARRAVPAARRGDLPPRCAYPERRMRRAGLLPPRRQIAARRRAGRETDPGCGVAACSRAFATTSTRSRRTRCRSPTRPNTAWSIPPTRSRRWATLAKARGLGFHMDGARFANAVAHLGCDVADLTWRAGVDALSFGFVKNGGMSAEALVFFKPELADGEPVSPQAGRAAAVQGPLSRRADPRDARRRPVAGQCPRGECRRGDAGEGGGRPAWSIRSRPTRCSCARRPTRPRAFARWGSISTTGRRARCGW